MWAPRGRRDRTPATKLVGPFGGCNFQDISVVRRRDNFTSIQGEAALAHHDGGEKCPGGGEKCPIARPWSCRPKRGRLKKSDSMCHICHVADTVVSSANHQPVGSTATVGGVGGAAAGARPALEQSAARRQSSNSSTSVEIRTRSGSTSAAPWTIKNHAAAGIRRPSHSGSDRNIAAS